MKKMTEEMMEKMSVEEVKDLWKRTYFKECELFAQRLAAKMYGVSFDEYLSLCEKNFLNEDAVFGPYVADNPYNDCDGVFKESGGLVEVSLFICHGSEPIWCDEKDFSSEDADLFAEYGEMICEA